MPGTPVVTAGGDSPTAVITSWWNGTNATELDSARRGRPASCTAPERGGGNRRRHPDRRGQVDREALCVHVASKIAGRRRRLFEEHDRLRPWPLVA